MKWIRCNYFQLTVHSRKRMFVGCLSDYFISCLVIWFLLLPSPTQNVFFFNSALQQGKWLPYFDIISNQWWMFITTAYGGKGVAIEGVKTAQKSSNIAVAPQKTTILLSLLILSISLPKIIKISKNLWQFERVLQKPQSGTNHNFLAWFV